MENKEKFATFFSEASKGRKLGAILVWIAAVALIAAMFVPAFGIGLSKDVEEAAAQISSQLSGSDEKTLVNGLEESGTSLVGYLTKDSATLTQIETGEEASRVLDIACLVVYAVLVIATAVLALFTMNVLGLVTVVLAVAEILALYFMSYSQKLNSLLGSGITKPTLNLIVIIVLVVAVVLAIVGTILTYTIHSDDEDEIYDDDSYADDRNAETGLFDETSTTAQAAAHLVQMNTGKAFAIQEGAELVIGKGSQANIIVSNPIISRAHAKISFRGGVCTIQDLGSKNGTFVGDQKLPSGGSTIVPNGAYITLGNEIFQFNF